MKLEVSGRDGLTYKTVNNKLALVEYMKASSNSIKLTLPAKFDELQFQGGTFEHFSNLHFSMSPSRLATSAHFSKC